MGNLFSGQDTLDLDGNVPLNLLLMGKTGHGKSALGNSILGCKAFEVSRNLNSKTPEVMCAYSKFQSFSLKVVDLPGLMDTELSKLKDTERAIDNMKMALTTCCEGVHAFLFVFRVDVRFTEEEVYVLETLKTTFGKDYLKRAIVVLTRGDLFDMENVTFDGWCKKQTGPFRQLYDACDRRCVLFNNNEKDAEKQIAQREKLTQLAHTLKLQHGCYTSDSFKRAAPERQKLIKTLKHAILEKEYKRQAGTIGSNIDTYREQPCAKQRAEIENAILNLKNDIKTQDNCTEFMQIVETLQGHFDTVQEVHNMTATLDQTRKIIQTWGNVGE